MLSINDHGAAMDSPASARWSLASAATAQALQLHFIFEFPKVPIVAQQETGMLLLPCGHNTQHVIRSLPKILHFEG